MINSFYRIISRNKRERVRTRPFNFCNGFYISDLDYLQNYRIYNLKPRDIGIIQSEFEAKVQFHPFSVNPSVQCNKEGVEVWWTIFKSFYINFITFQTITTAKFANSRICWFKKSKYLKCKFIQIWPSINLPWGPTHSFGRINLAVLTFIGHKQTNILSRSKAALLSGFEI